MVAATGRTLVCGLAVLLGAIALAPGAQAGTSTLSIKPISGVFDQGKYETKYTVAATDSVLERNKTLKYTWTLTLTPIDQPSPSFPTPGVDPPCNDGNEKGRQAGPEANTYIWPDHGPAFVWHHGSTPPTTDNCQHALQGVRGHQGIVSVTVSDGLWQCTAEFYGTETDTGVQPAPCVEAKAPGMLLAALTKMDVDLEKLISGVTSGTIARDARRDETKRLQGSFKAILDLLPGQTGAAIQWFGLADLDLSRAQQAAGAGDMKKAGIYLDNARLDVSAGGRDIPELPDNDLWVDIGKTANDVNAGKLDADQVKSKVAGFVKAKEALLGTYSVYGVNFFTLFTAFNNVSLNLAAAYDADHKTDALGFLTGAKAAKQSAEKDLHKAAGTR